MEFGESGFDGVAVQVDERFEACGCKEAGLDGYAMLRCLSARLLVGNKPALGFFDSTLEELLTLAQTGVANLEIFATRCQQCSTRLESCTSLAARFGSVGLGLFVGLECRHQRLEFADATPLAIETLGCFGDDPSHCIGFGGGLAAVAVHAHETFGGSSESRVVGVESTGEIGLSLTGRCLLGLGRPQRCVAALEFGGGIAGTIDGLFESSSGGSPTRCTETPSGSAKPVAVVGNNRCRRVRQRTVERG